jgi:hypothetical protein
MSLSMNKFALAAALAAVLPLGGQVRQDAASGAFRVNLPGDAPIALATADWGQSRAEARGGALQVDLHSMLQFRNTSPRHIRGVSLLVLAQEVTPGGKASVTVPSLDVAPGDSFPVKVDLRLMRPLTPGSGPLVEVGLDGVLFEDLTFYGPDRLNSRRTMLAWELEARRDRKAFLARLDADGPEALRGALVAVLARMAEEPRLDIQVARANRASAVSGSPVQFALLAMPDAPVGLTAAEVVGTGNEIRFPRIDVVNRSRRAVRFVDVSWMVRDDHGREAVATNLPAEVALAPGATTSIHRENTVRVSLAGGGPLNVTGVTGFVGLVEFADGELWVPSKPVAAVTGEQQRLAELYRRRGLAVVLDQLRRLR